MLSETKKRVLYHIYTPICESMLNNFLTDIEMESNNRDMIQ